MSTTFIREYCQLINNEHELYSQIFKAAVRFDTVMASFFGLRTSEAHTEFAKTVLENYDEFKQQLEVMLLDYTEEFYRGLKREKKERRERIFICAYKCCLGGAFYSKNELIEASNRDIFKCDSAMPVEEAIALVQKAFDAKLGIEYRLVDELLEFDYFAMQFAMEFCDDENVETRFIERLRQKNVTVPTEYNVEALAWAHFPDVEQAVGAVLRKDLAEQLEKIVERYSEAGMDDVQPSYIARACYTAYLLRFKGWELGYGPESQIVLSHDGVIVHEYM